MTTKALSLVNQCLKTNGLNLRLVDCGLTDKDFAKEAAFYLSLRECQHIQVLELGSNQISKIRGLENLTALKQLVLYNNQIEVIEGLENLTNLNKLYLHKNQISEICGLDKLVSLKELALSSNKISKIEGLEKLILLQELYLHENLISRVYGLENLENLQKLTINNNQIDDIKPLIPFLEKKKRQLKIICNGKGETNINEINVGNNPLVSPPVEVAKQGSEAILNYFTAIEKQGIEYLYEAKLLILGQPRAGKTSLRYKLLDINAPLPTEDKTTRGIDIERMHFDIIDVEGNPRKFYYNVWDFGGQHIYQTTHQFFITHRSLYVLVIDTGKDNIGNDDSTLNYWLQAIELLGGNSPLMLVRNEKNERQLNIDIPQKKARFNFLKGDYSVNLNALILGTSSFDKKLLNDFASLKEDVEKELKRLPLAGYPMPKNWVQIRNELYTLSRSKYYISRDEYIEICETYGVIDYDRQMELSHVFHDLGIFLHFQDYGSLEDFIILQNTWATDAVFAILDNQIVQKNKGKFSDNDLIQIWKERNYSQEVYKKLLALMMQFELCYQIDKVKPNTYIMPEMLSDSAPDNYEWEVRDDDMLVEYRYDFMPKGILTRLIVRLHKYISMEDELQIVWKTGVKVEGSYLDCPTSTAEIIETWDNKKLLVRAHGSFAKDLMGKITFQIDELNNEFFREASFSSSTSQKSKWYKMIPCNCIVCKNSTEKHFYDNSELLERKSFGKETIECTKKPFAVLNISDLLDGGSEDKNKGLKIYYENIHSLTEKSKENEKIKRLKKQTLTIFLASSSELKEEREQFEIFINRENKYLNEKGIFLNLELWEDFLDKMSQTRLQDEYNKTINTSDIFVMLFFTKVGKYTAEEFEIAFKHFKEKNNPKIFTYFKKDGIVSTNIDRDDMNSLLDFKDKLKELGHFNTIFEGHKDLHLHFKKQLERLYGI